MGFSVCSVIRKAEIRLVIGIFQPFSTPHANPEGSLHNGKKRAMKENLAEKGEPGGDTTCLKPTQATVSLSFHLSVQSKASHYVLIMYSMTVNTCMGSVWLKRKS